MLSHHSRVFEIVAGSIVKFDRIGAVIKVNVTLILQTGNPRHVASVFKVEATRVWRFDLVISSVAHCDSTVVQLNGNIAVRVQIR